MTDRPVLGRRRRALGDDPRAWVQTGPMPSGAALPLLATPARPGMDAAHWLAGHRDLVDGWVRRHGAVLFRGFLPADPAAFRTACLALSPELLTYAERSSPRHQVRDQVYTSTDYPADYPIFLHNENSYQAAWPMRLYFFCAQPSAGGGETPLADCRAVRADLPAELVAAFRERGVMYVRNYGERLGLPWTSVFQTEDRAAVDAYCAGAGIETEWLDGDRLRTRAVRRVPLRHPVTGQDIWFNHATFFHISTLRSILGKGVMAEEADADLPTHAYWGDGRPMEDAVVAELRAAYLRHETRFTWQAGDFLVLDNMLCAHGRAPYTGDRAVLVAMADPMRSQDACSEAHHLSQGEFHA